MSTEKADCENTVHRIVGEEAGQDSLHPCCLVPGELKTVPIGSLLEQLKTVISETEDNGQPHSGMEFLCIIKRRPQGGHCE